MENPKPTIKIPVFNKKVKTTRKIQVELKVAYDNDEDLEITD